MNPYRIRAIDREPAPPMTLARALRRLDYLFTERPARWMVFAGAWFLFWFAWGLLQP